MFELKDIKAAQSVIKTGADFPKYVQQLIKLGVKKYETYVSDGHTVYYGEDNFRVTTDPLYPRLSVANISDKDRFKHFLKNHQRGQTDFPAFCKHAADTGVEKWTMDMETMTCTYVDKANNRMLEEQIPAG
jgi:uncharacterized protein YbcV (DUF1398 family)